MAMKCAFALFGFIELGIGALALVLEEKLRRFNIDILLFKREILVVIPNESLVLVSGLFLLLAWVMPIRCLIKLNMNIHILTSMFNVACVALMGKNLYAFQESQITTYDINMTLGGLIGILVFESLLAIFIICYLLVVLPPSDSEDSPVPKTVSSTTTDPLCPTEPVVCSTEPKSGPLEGETAN